MKKLLTLTVLAIAISIFGTMQVSAQKKPAKAKDLFTQYNDNNPSTVGAEGAKVAILLKRGNSEARLVSPNETFYSGDKIKLVLDINFSGYAVILNKGTSGKINPLFPYLENGELVDHSVSPNAAVQLPKGNAWINFDSNPGDEQVTVIFSKNPINEMDRYEESSTGTRVDSSRADQILAELNSKSLARRKSKDLFTQTESDGTYCVSQDGLGSEPVGFSFYLKHR
jgi:hypothetical protein